LKGAHKGRTGIVQKRKSSIVGNIAEYWNYVVTVSAVYDEKGVDIIQKAFEIEASHDELEII